MIIFLAVILCGISYTFVGTFTGQLPHASLLLRSPIVGPCFVKIFERKGTSSSFKDSCPDLLSRKFIFKVAYSFTVLE